MSCCPSCQSPVAFRDVLTASGISGVVCGRCRTTLQMTRSSRLLCFALAGTTAFLAGRFLLGDWQAPLRVVTATMVWAAALLAAWRWLGRYRPTPGAVRVEP